MINRWSEGWPNDALALSLGVFVAGATRMVASIGAVYPAPISPPFKSLFVAAVFAGIATNSIRRERRIFGSTLIAIGTLLGWIVSVVRDRVTLGWGHRMLEVELPFVFLVALAGAAVATIPFLASERRGNDPRRQ